MSITIKPEEDSKSICINTKRILYITEPKPVSLRYNWFSRILMDFKDEDYWSFRIEFGNDYVEVIRDNLYDLKIEYDKVEGSL